MGDPGWLVGSHPLDGVYHLSLTQYSLVGVGPQHWTQLWACDTIEQPTECTAGDQSTSVTKGHLGRIDGDDRGGMGLFSDVS